MPELLADPLWVPILTHYRPDGRVDSQRFAAHVTSLRPDVSQFMLGGSTGDGWELDESRFEQLLDAAAATLGEGQSAVIGALRPSTGEVIERVRRVGRAIEANDSLRARIVGIVVCPPVGQFVSQAEIDDHFRAVMDATPLDIIAYQLPQVTKNRIAPKTLANLAGSGRISMFKDSSGEDGVATDGSNYASVALLRGAEGRYLDLLAPSGPYHGWLLSTGNALARGLRAILAAHRCGDEQEARRLSSLLESAVDSVFSAAARERGANAFSNANRALDHLRAYGPNWRHAPLPSKVDGSSLSPGLLAEVERIMAPTPWSSGGGYLECGAG